MKNGQTIGQWLNWDFDVNGDLYITDRNGNDIYYETSEGRWCKRERDSQGNQIYAENSEGHIEDTHIPKIFKLNGRKYQLIP
jgi:hypothetical protein